MPGRDGSVQQFRAGPGGPQGEVVPKFVELRDNLSHAVACDLQARPWSGWLYSAVKGP